MLSHIRSDVESVVSASEGANGVAGDTPELLAEDLEPLFECIVREVAPPSVRLEAPLQMLVTNLDCAPPPLLPRHPGYTSGPGAVTPHQEIQQTHGLPPNAQLHVLAKAG